MFTSREAQGTHFAPLAFSPHFSVARLRRCPPGRPFLIYDPVADLSFFFLYVFFFHALFGVLFLWAVLLSFRTTINSNVRCFFKVKAFTATCLLLASVLFSTARFLWCMQFRRLFVPSSPFLCDLFDRSQFPSDSSHVGYGFSHCAGESSILRLTSLVSQ